MNLFIDKKVKKLFINIFLTIVFFTISSVFLYKSNLKYKIISIILLNLLLFLFISFLLLSFFKKRNAEIAYAKNQIQNYIINEQTIDIETDEDGEIYKLFHEINSLISILNAHTERELKSKEFFKEIIFDISHQIKTPIAALNIYNGIIQDEGKENPVICEFTDLSEKELDRIELLIKNLLTIAKLDMRTLTMNKSNVNISDIMDDIKSHFSYRANLENKNLKFIGDNNLFLYCDRTWINEALSNIIKNAFDHTDMKDNIIINWQKIGSIIQITIKDNGRGIHNEDINYIFKRFYRSRFSKDTQGVGLGLPLTKSIINAHNGSIEVDSQLNLGTIFTINFLIPTKL